MRVATTAAVYEDFLDGPVPEGCWARLDFDERKTRRYLRVGRALKQMHLVRTAYSELGWSRTEAILSRVQTATQKEWIEFACSQS